MSLINIARRIVDNSQWISRFVVSSYASGSNLTFARYNSSAPGPPDLNESVNKKLLEFFDTKKNWGENDIKHGRSWSLPELRIKSNQDLHKLWFILLKENNMLLTMEEQAKEEHRLFPSPERIDKVKQSMENLESVVRERNRAYFELETGETGERPGRLTHNQLGMRFFYRSFEHVVPFFMNKKWRADHKFKYGGHAVRKFLCLYREKIWDSRRKKMNRDRNQVIHLLKRNPDLDKNLLKRKFPSVDIEKLEKGDKFRGNYVPKV